MNSASSGKTYIKMQNQLLRDDDCACFLVEAIAKRSQNIKWETTIDGQKVSHKRIRRVSLDRFYKLVTGEEDAFYQVCMALPETIEIVIADGNNIKTPEDTVFSELRSLAMQTDMGSTELAMSMAMYLLGFNSYIGFSKDGEQLNRLYEYASRLI